MYISVDESQMGVFFLDCFRFCMNDIEYDIILNKAFLFAEKYFTNKLFGFILFSR